MPDPELLAYVRDQLGSLRSAADIRRALIEVGWLPSAADEVLAYLESQGELGQQTVGQSPSSLVSDPGYMDGFSWGYFGTSVVYALAMRLGFFQILQPFLILVVWLLVSIPIGILLSFFPRFGPYVLEGLEIVVPAYLLYFGSRQMRAVAYRNRTWQSPADFVSCQKKWDKAGQTVFLIVLLALFAYTSSGMVRQLLGKPAIIRFQPNLVASPPVPASDE